MKVLSKTKGSRQNLAASFFVAAALIVASLVGVPFMAQAQETNLSPQQARFVAREAIKQGNLDVANALSSALLARDANDAEALMVRAMLQRAAGDLDGARETAGRAHANTDIPALKFDAAMLVADILTREEKYTRAQIWLRRADQAANDDQRKTLVANAYRVVQRRNPLRVQLRFSLNPSNNVNNGAETTLIEIGGLPFRIDDSGLKLGGYEASAGVSLAYRFSESETQKTEAIAELYYRHVWLDSDAKEIAPDAKGSDYNYATVVTGLRQQRLIWPDLGITQATGLLGQSWYGDKGLARWAELQLSQMVKQSDVSALRFGATLRSERRLDNDINDARTLGLSVEYLRGLGDSGAYSVGLSVRDIRSESATVDGLSYAVTASRSFPRIGAVLPKINLRAETRDYQKWATTADGREDDTLSLSLDMVFPDVTYYGFAPQLAVSARRTWSDVDIYDRNQFSVGLTAVSRF